MSDHTLARPAPPDAARRLPLDTGALIASPLLRRVYRPLQPLVEATFGFPALRRLYDRTSRPGLEGAAYARAVLAHLGITCDLDASELAPLQRFQGPLLVVVNHPFGGLDSLGVMLALEAIRPGAWRLFSNQIMSAVPEFESRMIPVDSLGVSASSQRVNRRGLADALRHLQQGGVVGAFPAGRVSHRDRRLGVVCDRAWSEHVVRIADASGAAIACLHIPGSNSRRFLRVPRTWFRLRSLLLCRELVRPATATVRLQVAGWYEPGAVRRLAASPAPSAQLRALCYVRHDRDLPRPLRARAESAPPEVAAPQSREQLAAEIAALGPASRLLGSPDGSIEVLMFRGDAAPTMLRELGRCRELTFRAAGQGVGRACDIAPEDEYYHHLVLWQRERREIIGAYRLGFVREILASHGPTGLYLDHVFKIRPAFYARLGAAVELSRSFVMPANQRDNRALALLWRGLGAAAARAQCASFFGSVTVSNDHHPASRAILVEHLQRNHADAPALRRLVRARRPFRAATKYHPLVGAAFAGQPLDALAPIVEGLEDGARGIPPLMRYYCALGAKFLAFHVEPSFQDALYCLLRVDINAIPAGFRQRFLGS